MCVCVCVCAVFERLIIVVLAQFTCFISTKVQILTPEGLQWFERLIIVGIVYSSLSLAIDAPLLPEESSLKKWLVVSNYTLRCQYLYFCTSDFCTSKASTFESSLKKWQEMAQYALIA